MISSPESLVPFSVADRTDLASETDASFTFEALSGTILKFEGSILSTNPSQPAASDQTVAAMQRLVELIDTLRTSELSSADASAPWQTGRTQTPEALAPYITEEAYEVLDAFKVSALAAGIESDAPPAESISLVTVETLILHLLWSIARSSYTAMQLIEGVKVRCLQPDQIWADGMLRLVALLETSLLENQAETLHWCFDIATGQPPTQWLERNDRIQSDDNSLPIEQSFNPNEGTGERRDRVEHHLQELIQQLQDFPLLRALLEGISIERLQPGENWQSSQLRLKLRFEFVAQSTTPPKFDSVQLDLVEAELLEETSGVDLSWRYPSHADPHALSRYAGVHVLVRELPSRSLNAATLIRLADPQQLENYAQTATDQSLVKSIAQLQQFAQTRDSDNLLDLIIQAAWQAATHSPLINAYSLLQPELLMDELIPKLLWQLTRSAYEVMQLVGGVEVEVLQPSSTWQSGTLRLLAILQIEADCIDYKIDLATGRLLTDPLPLLSPTAVCQRHRSGDALSQPDTSIVCQEPVHAATILSCLLQQIRAATPEIELFLDSVAIEWLEAEQDWQPGVLTLSLGLEFNSTHS